MSYWIVNSYGYPNPFSEIKTAREAWDVFDYFLQFNSYQNIRSDWESTGRNTSGIESWKAAFEEFGLLYVLSRTDEIIITPAGRQIKDAADNNNHDLFVWIGLNLLLRYPLKGPPRPRPKGDSKQHTSDLLPYAFLLAVLKDLGYLWRAELDHILCRVFSISDVGKALEEVKQLRSSEKKLEDFSISENAKHGNFYNIINQIVLHCSMGFELLEKDSQEIFYPTSSLNYKYSIKPRWMDLVNKALGGTSDDGGCFSSSSFVARMPSGASFNSEKEYFERLGESVPSIPTIQTYIATHNIGGFEVAILKEGKHYSISTGGSIQGTVEHLCKVFVDQRVIVSHELTKTYIVVKKEKLGNQLILTLRGAKPLHITTIINDLLNGSNT